MTEDKTAEGGGFRDDDVPDAAGRMTTSGTGEIIAPTVSCACPECGGSLVLLEREPSLLYGCIRCVATYEITAGEGDE